jgi:hypothetical protein
MAGLFWDTSALVKHYHPEVGKGAALVAPRPEFELQY